MRASHTAGVDAALRLAVQVVEEAGRWEVPGGPVLAPHLTQALSARPCPAAVTAGFGGDTELRWSGLRWPADVARHAEARYALRVCTELVRDLRLLDPAHDTPAGRWRLRLLLSGQVAPRLGLGIRAMGLLDVFTEPETWLTATVGAVLGRRILYAGLADVLELSWALNLGLALLRDLEDPSPTGWVHALCLLARHEPPHAEARLDPVLAAAPVRVWTVTGPAPAWAGLLRVDDPRVADLVPLAAGSLPAGTLFAAAYQDPQAAAVLAPCLSAVADRVAALKVRPLEEQVTDLLLAVLGTPAQERQRILASRGGGWGGALADRMGLLGPPPRRPGTRRAGLPPAHAARLEREASAALMRREQWWLPGLDQALRAVEWALPLTESKVGALLAEQQLTGPRMTGGALLRIALLAGTPLGGLTAGEDGVLRDLANHQASHLAALVRRHCATSGVTTTERIRAELQATGISVAPARLDARIAADPGITVGPGGWYWPTTPTPGDPLTAALLQQFAVHPALNLPTLHAGLRRAWPQQRDLIPDLPSLRAYLNTHPDFVLGRDGKARLTRDLDPAAVLAPEVAALVDALRAVCDPTVDEATLRSLARQAGLTRPALKRLMDRAPFLDPLGPDAWALRGAPGTGAHGVKRRRTGTPRPGVQPEQDGHLQCLECGRWYRQLGQHLSATHDLHPDDYRRAHQLPRSRGLHAADILDRRSQHGKQRYADDPQALRAQLTPTRTTLAERVALSAAARSESARRAGSRPTAQRNGAAVHQAWLASIDARFDEHARRLGHPDAAALLDATRGLTDPAFAHLVGVTTKQAANFRRRHHIPAPGRWAADRIPKHLSLRPPMPPEQLAAIETGCQPTQHGHLLCLECGRLLRSLPQHLAVTHQITADTYRSRHDLSPTVPLRSTGTGRPG